MPRMCQSGTMPGAPPRQRGARAERPVALRHAASAFRSTDATWRSRVDGAERRAAVASLGADSRLACRRVSRGVRLLLPGAHECRGACAARYPSESRPVTSHAIQEHGRTRRPPRQHSSSCRRLERCNVYAVSSTDGRYALPPEQRVLNEDCRAKRSVSRRQPKRSSSDTTPRREQNLPPTRPRHNTLSPYQGLSRHATRLNASGHRELSPRQQRRCLSAMRLQNHRDHNIEMPPRQAPMRVSPSAPSPPQMTTPFDIDAEIVVICRQRLFTE